MTDPDSQAREIVKAAVTYGNVLGEPVHLFVAGKLELEIGEALSAARRDEREKCAKVADARAALMNRLGSDAKQERRMTIAEIQAVRVLEAKQIADEIRALSPAPKPDGAGAEGCGR